MEELKGKMNLDDLEMNMRQLNAVLALEKALKRCGRTGVAIFGKGNSLVAYNGRKLEVAYKMKLVTWKETKLGQIPYAQIDDAGSYENSGPDKPLFLKKKKKKKRRHRK